MESRSNAASSAHTHNTERQNGGEPAATAVTARANVGIDFYRKYLGFLTPLHYMRRGDMEVLANLLLRREELAKICLDKDVVDDLLFSTKERAVVRERTGCGNNSFKQSLVNLRRCKAIKDGKINPLLIPRLDGSNRYLLMVDFWLYGSNET